MKALLMDDDSTFRKVVADSLRRDYPGELDLVEVATLTDAQKAVESSDFDLFLVDIVCPASPADADRGRVDPQAGVKLITHLREKNRSGRIVVLSCQDKSLAVQLLITQKIHDYLFKDTPWKEIRARLDAQVEKIRLQEENLLLRAEVGREGDTPLIGRSASLFAALERADRAAPVDTSVLILGETGTGKELVARRIHRGSARARGPFVVVNCAALSESLLESELFGHAKGSFTGAVENRIGRFEVANGGTLFLDEVGEIPLHLQPKLLRVLQEQTFERVGESKPRTVNVRLISATNRSLEKESREGRFRTDLYYRLNVFHVRLPPLRERAGDVGLLARHFVSALARKLGKRIDSIAPDTEAILCRFDWPGNIRQLRNTIEAAMIVETMSELQVASLPGLGNAPSSSSGTRAVAEEALNQTTGMSYQDAILGFERVFLDRALDAMSGDVALAAETIGLPLRTLRDRLKRCGLDPSAHRRRPLPGSM